jgi:hypothetical protein
VWEVVSFENELLGQMVGYQKDFEEMVVFEDCCRLEDRWK